MNEKLSKSAANMYKEGASMTDVANLIADSLGLGRTQSMAKARQIWDENFDEEYVPINLRNKLETTNEPETTAQTSFTKQGENQGVLEHKGKRIKTLEDLVAECKIDKSKWKIDKYTCNKWEVGAKDPNGNIVTSPLFQVKAFLSRKEEDKLKPVIDFFKKSIASEPSPVVPALPKFSGLMYEISIPDLHVGKLAWHPETGDDPYDLKEAERLFKEASKALLGHVDLNAVEEVVIPVGNDFFNSEGLRQSTTKGTPQDDDGRWPKSFMVGCKLITDLVGSITNNTKVRIVITPGNHDQERCFYLGEYLKAWYKNNERVVVDNTPKLRKYYKFGKNLIAWTHGSEEKHADLPLIMARESKDFSSCKYYYIHLGHLHTDWLREYKGVKIRVLPSLCSPDAWHANKGFVGNQRSAIGIVYDRNQGEVANYYYTL